MRTSDFKTRNCLVFGHNKECEGYWPIGLDIGYSAVKGMAQNKWFSFPAYARQLPERTDDDLESNRPNDIRYREVKDDGTYGPEWAVGELAYDAVNADEVIYSEAELYGREHYKSEMYLVLALTGVGLGLMGNSAYGIRKPDDKIILQLGLPPKYKSGDTGELKSIFSRRRYVFELKIGNGEWLRASIKLDADDIYVMAQPLGALISASVDREGNTVPDAKKYFSDMTIVFDPGFGTTDIYVINKGIVTNQETFSELGMKKVFEKTCREIKDRWGEDIKVAELQNYLDKGVIRTINQTTFQGAEHSFKDILQKYSNEVCNEAIKKLRDVHNFSKCEYLITTGGTYDAWSTDFNAAFSNIGWLKIIPANINDNRYSNIFSNVRGYYFYRSNLLKGARK